MFAFASRWRATKVRTSAATRIDRDDTAPLLQNDT